jgi:hypothetical protein
VRYLLSTIAAGLLTAAGLLVLLFNGAHYTIYDAWLFGIYGGVMLIIAALWRD